MAKYFIGIDLGTTHSAVFYAEQGEDASLQQLLIPQLTAAGRVEELALLPSFAYFPHATEFLESDGH